MAEKGDIDFGGQSFYLGARAFDAFEQTVPPEIGRLAAYELRPDVEVYDSGMGVYENWVEIEMKDCAEVIPDFSEPGYQCVDPDEWTFNRFKDEPDTLRPAQDRRDVKIGF